MGSPSAFSCILPRGGALCPPAVGPSTTKPSIEPLARLRSAAASTCDETMARKSGRLSGGSGSGRCARGSNDTTRRRVVGVSGQRERIAGRFVAGQSIEDARHAERNAGAHQHVVDAGQHGAVERGEVRDLDLLEIVDADRIRVALARQPDLDEVGDDAELDQLRRVGDVVQRHRLERLRRALPARHEVGVPDAVGNRTEGN